MQPARFPHYGKSAARARPSARPCQVSVKDPVQALTLPEQLSPGFHLGKVGPCELRF